jgi:acetyl-CoA synthase
VGFPNTAYYLPVIYGMLGAKVEKLGDMEPVLKKCQALLPPLVKEEHPLPYLGPALDAGMATLFAQELIEAIRYLDQPNFYVKGEDVHEGNIWLGAADDIILRKRGVEFVDGTAPGFAAILGAAPTKEIAAKIASELQQKNLYVFMSAEYNGQRFSQQLLDAGIQIGWPTRLVSFGPDVSATVFALGFALRPPPLRFSREFRKILIYNKIDFAFALPMGFVTTNGMRREL